MFCGGLWWLMNQNADILQTSFFKYSKISKKNKKTHVTKSKWFQIHFRVNLMKFKQDESIFMLMASVSDEGGKQNKINGSFA